MRATCHRCGAECGAGSYPLLSDQALADVLPGCAVTNQSVWLCLSCKRQAMFGELKQRGRLSLLHEKVAQN